MHIDREHLKQLEQEEAGVSEALKQPVPEENSETAPPKKQRLRIRKPGRYIWLAVIALLILAAVLFKVHIDNSYEPGGFGKEIDVSSLNIDITDNMIVVRNPKRGTTPVKTGIIFYQNTRVSAECYLPLMEKLALKGYDCFLPISFGNLPYLNVDGADTAIRKYEAIKRWIVVGHGAGCKAAASFTKDNPEKVQGIVYLGGYASSDLSAYPIYGLSLIGSKDTVVDPSKFERSKKNDPEDMEYQTIKGGNNSCFADTYLLEKDTPASISFDRQTNLSAELIHNFLQNHRK